MLFLVVASISLAKIKNIQALVKFYVFLTQKFRCIDLERLIKFKDNDLEIVIEFFPCSSLFYWFIGLSGF